MSRLINIVLAASLGASCGDYGAYGVELGAPVYETTPSHDELFYQETYGWYYPYGGWLGPAPAPRREERQERAPQAPLPPPPAEPAPQADDDADRDPK